MKKKKAKNNYKVVAGIVCLAVVIAVVGVINIGKAQMRKSEVAELIELANSLGGNVEVFQASIAYLSGGVGEMFGASGDYTLSSFTAKEIQTSGITIDGPMYFLTDSDVDLSSVTTTPSVNIYSSIRESLDLTGTSTVKGATQNIISYYTNTGSDLFLDSLAIDVSTQFTMFEASVQCSTSTWYGGVEGGSLLGTTTAGIIASTTIASTFDTGDSNILYPNMMANPGASQIYASSSPVLLKNGEVLFCTWTPYGATSSASFTAAGGFTGVGNMIANTHARGN